MVFTNRGWVSTWFLLRLEIFTRIQELCFQEIFNNIRTCLWGLPFCGAFPENPGPDKVGSETKAPCPKRAHPQTPPRADPAPGMLKREHLCTHLASQASSCYLGHRHHKLGTQLNAWQREGPFDGIHHPRGPYGVSRQSSHIYELTIKTAKNMAAISPTSKS